MASHSRARFRTRPSVARPGIVLESTNISYDFCSRRSIAIDPTYTTKNARKKKDKKPKEPKAKEKNESFEMKAREQNAYFNDIDENVTLIVEKECEDKAIIPGVNDRASMYARNDRESISAAEESSFFVGLSHPAFDHSARFNSFAEVTDVADAKAIISGVNNRTLMYVRNDRESISAAEESSVFVGSSNPAFDHSARFNSFAEVTDVADAKAIISGVNNRTSMYVRNDRESISATEESSVFVGSSNPAFDHSARFNSFAEVTDVADAKAIISGVNNRTSMYVRNDRESISATEESSVFVGSSNPAFDHSARFNSFAEVTDVADAKTIISGVNNRTSMYVRNDRESISAAEESSFFVGSSHPAFDHSARFNSSAEVTDVADAKAIISGVNNRTSMYVRNDRESISATEESSVFVGSSHPAFDHSARFNSSAEITDMANASGEFHSADDTLDRVQILHQFYYLKDFVGELTNLNCALHICGQKRVAGWFEFEPTGFIKCKKLGEGTFGEVYKTSVGDEEVALKVLPFLNDDDVFTGLVNGERMKGIIEVLPELLITRELSSLSKERSNRPGFLTSTFVQVARMSIVRGEYPTRLLQEWDKYAKKSENDRPDTYSSPERLFLLLALSLGGKDLESYAIKNEREAFSIFFQIALSFIVAEEVLEFEHRDLHWGNILIKTCPATSKIHYMIDGVSLNLKACGVKVSIIDFTNSRMRREDTTIFLDLSADEELFKGYGDYQFDIYRMMREHNCDDWKRYCPYTNVLWLHYVATKVFAASKIPARRRTAIMDVMNGMLKSERIASFLKQEAISRIMEDYVIQEL